MELPNIRSYGRYSSDNYGAHTLRVNIHGIEVYFSYSTMVAFRSVTGQLVVHENAWGPTTGKHLNWIDGGMHKHRVNAEEFQRLWELESTHRVVEALEGERV